MTNYAKLTSLAVQCSILTASVIVILKAYAWFATGSLSVLSILFDSILDIIVSVINLLAVRYSLKPPDEDHKFGHNKAEDLAGVIQAAFIVASALFIASEAVKRFFITAPIENEIIGIWTTTIAIVLTFVLIVFQRYVIRHTNSTIVKADALHYLSDLLLNSSVVVSLVVYKYFHISYIDSIIALFIAGYILKHALALGKTGFNNLMDREFLEDERELIIQTILAHPKIRGFHDLRTRYAGNKAFIQFHLELDGNLPLHTAHAISEEVEQSLLTLHPEAEIMIHEDPETINPLPRQKEQYKRS